jgi:hypothetical protein
MSSLVQNPDFVEVIYVYYGQSYIIKVLSMRKF